jgi:hypothetical protein
MTTETSSRIGLGDVTPPEPPHPPRARLLALRFETDLPLIGLVLMIALLPLRSNWGVDLILFGLGFTVPGVLALRALRIPAASVRAFPIYVPAAALLVMTAAGLGCDLIGPHLGVAKPLHGDATALATVALSDILWLIGLRAPTAARRSSVSLACSRRCCCRRWRHTVRCCSHTAMARVSRGCRWRSISPPSSAACWRRIA